MRNLSFDFQSLEEDLAGGIKGCKRFFSLTIYEKAGLLKGYVRWFFNYKFYFLKL